MTPKEKALELVHLYDLMQTHIEGFSFYNAKQCALIAVDKILSEFEDFDSRCNPKYEAFEYVKDCILDFTEYWQEVKQEIEKL